ncbi:dolichol phosphate-mannose biosynthesis regulatory protein isoform X2 [Zootoca vivipara]|uniref:dolichol phosphate-mannose biosynthesis regulatory protein isoform X2 n=1 Tax=Zootoca vivipara TaxID=8524 RepID=UPI00293BB2B3|nr:dolichol phosphate-mannose biosynthesis regulatory protein isoform X2 [Zootoca vivipara]
MTNLDSIFKSRDITLPTKPFIEVDHLIHKYFLPREYSVIIPVVAGLVLLLFIGTFIATITWKNRKTGKKSA